MPVPFYRHGLRPEQAEAIARVLATPMLSSGPVGREVEEQLASFFGVPHALLTNSWTNGAIATLLALDIGPGDEVIVPAMTFIATANVVALVGATPVFVDVDPETLMMTPEGLEAAITPRTRAAIPVHLYGQMAPMRELAAVAERHGILLIEDAAHCFEGSRDGLRPGAVSQAAIFSFYATKNVTCGEGGAVITRDAELAERIRQTRLHGMSAGAADRFSGGRYRHWDMLRLGTKANLPDILAALLPDQIAHVEDNRRRREALARRYREKLSAITDEIVFPHWRADSVHAHHLFPVWVQPARRDRLLARLTASGIGATVNYRAVPQTSYWRQYLGWKRADRGFPVATRWGAGTFSLPLYPDLKKEEQDEVITTLARLLLADEEDE
ncbi:MAG: DegT/DnrJ/EryC1/StrS family aminotransferase [Alphaproteobacteria bacterium]|nr:MAG: DegT/DnrJ/EryC1/StrS family aminotransferase [Alphaproteobacteria bacterium]